MSKVLIVSISTGLGHNQAANCLKDELEDSGYSAHIVEPIKEGCFIDFLLDNGFKILARRLPKMYGKLYKITERKILNKSIAKFLNIALRNTLMEVIEEHKPDLLISTHPLLVNAVSFLKASNRIDIPFIAVVTDYMAHQFYVNKYVDAYIVGSKYTKDTLVAKGIMENKIFAFGIPIRREFRQPSELKQSNNIFSILLMAGSMGIPGIDKCLDQLIENKHNFKVRVVCGHNHKLREELEEKYSQPVNGKEVIVYGFTTKISELMDRSDLIITKPGGLTVSEAINKNIPMIIPYYIPGQEEENTEILVKAGVAISIADITELNEAVDRLYENPALLEKMRLKAQEFSQELSPDSIVRLADGLIDKHNSRRHIVHA
ncbi:MAG: glycosyltransferase [Peptococcaceae bacterium]|nr:glycosyltransferase [Peptococcaceae bacterium]